MDSGHIQKPTARYTFMSHNGTDWDLVNERIRQAEEEKRIQRLRKQERKAKKETIIIPSSPLKQPVAERSFSADTENIRGQFGIERTYDKIKPGGFGIVREKFGR
jgi:hypothetical protein